MKVDLKVEKWLLEIGKGVGVWGKGELDLIRECYMHVWKNHTEPYHEVLVKIFENIIKLICKNLKKESLNEVTMKVKIEEMPASFRIM